MGNKAGYAETILWTLGLTAGKSAGAYVWAEADDDVRALLRAYPDPALLLRVAEIIRGWADEEPRALWERLRAERKARVAAPADAAVSRFIWTIGRSMNCYDGDTFMPERSAAGVEVWNAHPPGHFAARVDSLAAFAMLASSNRLINVAGPDLRNTGKGGTTFGGAEFATPAGDVAGSFEEVAAWVVSSTWSYEQGNVATGFVGPGDRRQDTTATATARLAARSNWHPVAVLPRIPSADTLSAMLGTPGDLDGVVVYMDPPYLDTTGYLHTLGRDAVVSHAIDFASMGAHVAISEAVALPELMALGWYSADITGGRKGQKRTFSKQQREILTMNRPGAYVVAQQVGLFGGAK